ncbi:probable RNA helicase SDE3 isoform X1 [Cornus florida]|uniref:probable RNA helicase SDE3 isoform X1 n=1 Tax=Cornus florida TaxID=4283 RepID=UPI00289B984F|nr:probable RNA helicase SDE3 isoform X1 [Cornus florida]
MPQFLDILRCILCCNDEDDEETRNRNTYCELDRPVITQSHAQTDYDTFRSRFPPTYHCSTSSKSPPPTSSSTSSGTHSSSSKPPPPTNKPTLTKASPNLTNQQTKTNYVRVDKGASPIYVIPEDIKSLIEKDIVPGVLRKPLSASTYKDYFEALLYAEDYYHEKWDGFEMENVTLKLHAAAIYAKKGKYKDLNKLDEKDDKIFVAFEIDSIPERRPFLLSRDFASVRPSGRNVEPFQGIIYRVVKSNLVLVEFGEDFHSQHYSACKYTVKFSFNRVCLKRAHQAIAASSDPLFLNFLFPDVPRNSLTAFQVLPINHKLDAEKVSAVRQILGLKSPPPYLVEGSPSVTGMVVKEAVVQIYRSSPSCRILICAPINRTCDVLMRGLKKEIPESELFRANAAFRELDEVPPDILTSCPLKGECFSCPSLQELQKFKVILSTFMSSFRLHNEGIMAGHFSHIFLVDASSATEPETMVVLANLANEKTAVVITGAPWRHSSWVRSKIARENGLMTSYFERLCESKLYESLNPKFITRLQD